MSLVSRLAKDSAVYGLGEIFSKLISFISIIIYTRIFSISEFGEIEILVTFGYLLTNISNLGMDSTLTRFYFEKDNGKLDYKEKLISNILQIRILSTILVSIAFSFIYFFLLNYKLINPVNQTSLFLLLASLVFTQTNTLCSQVFRLRYKPWNFISYNFFISITNLFFVILFVLVFKLNLNGYFISIFLSSFISSLLALSVLKSKYILTPAFLKKYWNLLKFGIPFVPSYIFLYLMNSADRWFVFHYHGLIYTGIFSVGAKVVMLITSAVTIFRTAWLPISMEAIGLENSDKFFRQVSRIYWLIALNLLMTYILFSKFIVQIIAPSQYSDAWLTASILIWQPLCFGYFLIASIGIWRSKKTYLYIYLSILSSLIGIILNYLLVPNYSIVGASIATSITYLFWIISTLIFSEKIWAIGLLNKNLVLQILLGIFSTILLIWNLDKSFINALFIFIVCFLLNILISLRRSDLKFIKNEFKL